MQEARDEMNRAYLTFVKTLSPGTRQDLREAKVKLNEAYTAVETKQLNEKLKNCRMLITILVIARLRS